MAQSTRRVKHKRPVASKMDADHGRDPFLRRDDYLVGRIDDGKPPKRIQVHKNPIVAGSIKRGVKKHHAAQK